MILNETDRGAMLDQGALFKILAPTLPTKQFCQKMTSLEVIYQIEYSLETKKALYYFFHICSCTPVFIWTLHWLF